MVMTLLAAQSVDYPDEPVFTRERLVNMYPEMAPDTGAVGPAVIRHSAGLSTVYDAATASSSSSPVRAMKQIGNQVWILQGGGVHRLVVSHGGSLSVSSYLSAGAASKSDTFNSYLAGINGLSTGADVVALTDKSQLSIANSASQITIYSEQSLSSITNILSYIIVSDGITDRVYRSDLNDATTYGALNFDSAETFPDDMVCAHADHNELWLFGKYSTEIWQYDASKTAFPFSRIPGSVFEVGCFSARSVASIGGNVFWVDNLGQVRVASVGSAPRVLKNKSLEKAIKAQTSSVPEEEILGFTWVENGQEFYAVRFNDQPAWVYSRTTNRWHERSSGTNEEAYTVTCTAQMRGVQLMGCSDGIVRRVDPEAYQDGSTTVKRELITMPITNGQNNFRLPYFSVKCRTGVVDVGSEAQISMWLSRDGVTWGTEKVKNIGDLGDYDRVVTWRRLGQMRRAEVRLRMTDAIPFSIYGGEWEVA